MNIKLHHSSQVASGTLTITGSKSESNRLLVLQALFPQIEIQNLSNSDDSKVTQEGLNSEDNIIDIYHAGTAMRFLTAYFATRPDKEIVLTGSQRMQERPIKLLVEALNSLGADITYQKEVGFPPLIIKGKEISKNLVSLPANISSQYITALMLIAPSLKRGLNIDLIGETTSLPYIKMTQSIMDKLGLETAFDGCKISIQPQSSIEPISWNVESDWSSASYHFSMVALSQSADVSINSYEQNSLQGDSVLVKIYTQLGVTTSFNGHRLQLTKSNEVESHISLDLIKAPDLSLIHI